MKWAEFDKRLKAIELALQQLKEERRKIRQHPIAFLERIHGTFEDDEAFREAMRLGRQWRKGHGSSNLKKTKKLRRVRFSGRNQSRKRKQCRPLKRTLRNR